MAASSSRERIAISIKDHFQRLTVGCGDASCLSPHCASSQQFRHSQLGGNKNSLALLAVELAKSDTEVCGNASLVRQTSSNSGKRSVSPPIVLESSGGGSGGGGESRSSVGSVSEGAAMAMMDIDDSEVGAAAAVAFAPTPNREVLGMQTVESHNSSAMNENQSESVRLNQPQQPLPSPPPIDEVFNEATLRRMSGQPDKQPLIRLLSSVFTSPERTVEAFRPSHGVDDDGVHEKHESELSEKNAADALARIDVHCVHTLTRLIPYEKSVMDPLCGSVNFLCRQVRLELSDHPRPLHLCVAAVLFEFSVLFDPNNMETVVPSICMLAGRLPTEHQAALIHFWCRHKTVEDLRMLLLVLMQLLTLRCLLMENEAGEESERSLNEDAVICDVCRVIKLVYYASGLLGDVDSRQALAREREKTETFLASLNALYDRTNLPDRRRQGHQLWKPDPLAEQLCFRRPADCIRPAIPDEEFINDTLNELMSVDRDYNFFLESDRSPTLANRQRDEMPPFSFLNHPFLLTTFTKSVALYLDSRIRMFRERRGALLQSLMLHSDHNMYLRINVRRANIVQDALLTLEMVGLESPGDLKKQLVIEFEGEQGIDEGGLSKEFFQLIIEQIFNPDYGMFSLNQRTQSFWFYPGSEDCEREFVLVGMLLGLAIYNNIILDVRFPTVLYKKLTGKLGAFHDLKGSHPELAQGMQQLLEYDGDSFEDIFGCFSISFQDAFGSTLNHELKPDGANIPVTKENRQEFVDLYSDFLLNGMIEKQFNAFCKGFHLVIDNSLLLQLFAPTEIELLVCGSKTYNFHELQKYTQYDGGYTENSPIIAHFWKLVHTMSDVDKRLLLEFVTGSDRVPLGGMKKMKFIIARQGPDTDRLPTAHTCFNVLLLPEYSSYDKLQDRLLKAIANSKGFGML
ncbi:hypothetical protein BOX15_Mlig009753g1 [Macrostomum lignano]|uniref:HECT-type E3 ubiquitin transferase n=2 Tax=Macrostomum lignano TaxID=282301 RepID=A0A1I8HJ39_9PLAT|nr:hypothetical protein BOX15_Mlig009753g1 [Macrostomum lignano]